MKTWNLPESLFAVLVWGAIGLMAVSVVVLVVILVREWRRGEVW